MAEFLSNINMWLGYLLTLLSFVSFIVALIKAIKSKQYEKIKSLLVGFIEEAENLTSKNGEAVAGIVKKQVVLAKIQTTCANMGYKYVESVWSGLIDTYVELTLKVNQREQDKTKLVKAEEKPVVTGEQAQNE